MYNSSAGKADPIIFTTPRSVSQSRTTGTCPVELNSRPIVKGGLIVTGQNDFFTMQSLETLAGTVAATTFVVNGLRHAFNFNPAWLGLVVAEVVCLGTVYFTSGASGPLGSNYFVAIINGFFVFASAAGSTAAVGAAGSTAAVGAAGQNGRDEDPRGAGPPSRRFWAPWF
jgi:hypothetical protein